MSYIPVQDNIYAPGSEIRARITDGAIEADGEEGIGATFTLFFPMMDKSN